MRVAFLSAQAAFLDATGRTQAELARVQEQIATGQRFSRAAQDPAAATQALSIDGLLSDYERYGRNAVLAGNRLALEETALAGAGDLLQRVRELVVQAANGPLNAENRRMVVAEVRARIEELVATANTRDAGGEYIFGGTATRTQPFVRAAGSVVYQGDQGRRLVQVAADQFVADGDSGAAVFELVRNGNGIFTVAAAAGNAGTGLVGERTLVDPALYDGGAYTVTFTAANAWEARDAGGALVASGAIAPGDAIAFRGLSFDMGGNPAAGDSFAVEPSRNQSVFLTLERLVATLERPDGTASDRASLSNELATALVDIDQALGNLLEVRAGVGSRLSALESRQSQLEGAGVELKRALSGLRDTDYAEAITRLQQQLNVLQAAQQSFARVQGLSLFDYL